MLARRFCSLCKRDVQRNTNSQFEKFYSRLTNVEKRKKRNAMFEEEKARQMAFIKRLEKIEVKYIGQPTNKDGEVTLLMNRHVSTPYNCAMHINEFLMKRSIVALVDGEPWDMHRPLEDDCELDLKHMVDEDPTLPNKVFWRTGSFILGYIIDSAFKDDVCVQLCDFPRTKVEHGCFLYDVDLKIPNWKPTQAWH